MARRLTLNNRMGLLEDGASVVPQLTGDEFHGPGFAQVGYNEHNQRALLSLWADYLEKPPLTTNSTAVGTDNPEGIRPLAQTNGHCASHTNGVKA